MAQLTDNALNIKVRDAILSDEAYKGTWHIDILGGGGVITLLGSDPQKTT